MRNETRNKCHQPGGSDAATRILMRAVKRSFTTDREALGMLPAYFTMEDAQTAWGYKIRNTAQRRIKLLELAGLVEVWLIRVRATNGAQGRRGSFMTWRKTGL